MDHPKWELFISQRSFLRRYIVACFDEQHVLVQMADVESKDGRGELVKIQRMAACKLQHAPDTLWEFFKSQSHGDMNLKFSFSTNVHFNLFVPGKPVAVFCFNVTAAANESKEEPGLAKEGAPERQFSLEEFRAMFKKVIPGQ